MLDIPIPNNQLVTVMVAQTTFAVLTMPGKQYRVDYLEKAEAHLKPGMRGKFISYSAHPLLLNYNSRLVEVYINSRPQDPEKLLGEIRERIEAAFQGWRDWRCVLSGGENQLRKNLLDGSGLLLKGAPAIIAQSIINACTEYGALTYVPGDLENTLPVTPSFHLLLIGEGYVIAKDFRVVEVSKEKAQLPSR
jgi:hypothetical protein